MFNLYLTYFFIQLVHFFTCCCCLCIHKSSRLKKKKNALVLTLSMFFLISKKHIKLSNSLITIMYHNNKYRNVIPYSLQRCYTYSFKTCIQSNNHLKPQKKNIN